MKIVVEHDKEHHQFFSLIEGKKAKLDYGVLSDGVTLDYWSTYVPSELRGKQIAQQIVNAALNYAQENNYKVIPSCSFVQAYIESHPEYKKLVVK